MELGLAGNLLGFELAVEGFKDPVLEDIAEAGLYIAENETQARWPNIEDYCFGFEGFTGIANLQQYLMVLLEGGGGFEETALQAQLGYTPGNKGFRRAFRSDLCVSVERKS